MTILDLQRMLPGGIEGDALVRYTDEDDGEQIKVEVSLDKIHAGDPVLLWDIRSIHAEDVMLSKPYPNVMAPVLVIEID